MKKFSLKFIQVAWVAETIIVLLFTMLCVLFLGIERLNIWLQFLPLITGLIAAQGTAASIGPLVADKIKSGGKNE